MLYAMLPNLQIPSWTVDGTVLFDAFGFLVFVAVLVGFELGRLRARKTGLDVRVCADAMFWTVIGGFVLAHLVAAIFYFPERIVEDPLYLLKVWAGLSSFGGFLGGVLGSYLTLRLRKVPYLPYAEAILFGLLPGWVIGRLGCTIAFDHPGSPTTFFLGELDHAGVVRHNLGLYEMLVALALTLLVYALRNRRPFAGFPFVLVMIVYAPLRFVADFLRIGDPTYLGLTAGQYLAAAMFFGGVVLLVWGLRRPKPAVASPAPPTP
jgi:phosphatidylglycerol:prolipoprotein diacylglycerol transferase